VNIGILGAGQLARMMVLAGRAMGLEFRTLDPKEDSSVGDLCERCVEPYESPAALEWLREGADVVTFDFENVPTRVLHELAQQLPVRPGAAALEATQDRLHEKQLMQRLGIPVAPFRAVETRAELTSAIQELGLPLILKTRRGGYDGKGQVLLREAGDAGKYWDTIAGVPLIAEGFVSFEREISIVAVRGVDGDTRFYRIGENVHDSGILWISRCRPNDPSQAEAESIAASLMAELDYVGVITLEFFETPGGLLVNEFAPPRAQQRPLEYRRQRHEPVREPSAGDLWPASGLDPPARAFGDAESRRRAATARRPARSAREPRALLRETAAAWPEARAFDGAGRERAGARTKDCPAAEQDRAAGGAP
jgi:5-(carboxyamino)imidazole ribonucleotide synthase